MKKQSIRVLLVDDDAADAEVTQLSLGQARIRRFDVDRVDRLSAAVDRLAGGSFDAMLLDLGLPDSRGIETLQLIRAENDDIPIVLLTGLSDEEVGLTSLEQGAQDYLVKDTATPAVLERSICYAIQRQQQQRALAASNEQLEQKNRWLEALNETARQFVDNVSHDFRTPLTVIREYASILDDGLSGPVNDQQREFLGIILQRVEDLALMVDDMLDVSRLEAGLLGLRRRAGRAADLVERARTTLECRAKAKGVRFETEVPHDLPSVYCDFDKIGRVLVNLAVNAIKFTPRGGHVTLRAKANGAGEVVLGVTDDGPGIHSDKLATIFERFKQAGDQPEGGREGFGLGLNIARELVHLNLGTIDVQSEPGLGSTFSFTLPTDDPLPLFERYLNCVRNNRSALQRASSVVSLVRAELTGPTDDVAEQAADGFLQTAVGSHDLVYRNQARRWIAALRCPVEELGRLMQRVLAEWTELSENRPAGPLPELSLTPLGAWRTDRRRAELVSAFLAEAGGGGSTRPQTRRVLLVDDDDDLVQSLGLRLRSAGYDVLTACDGKQGAACALSEQPDVILLDVRMPVHDGLATLAELKGCAQTNQIPVIMLSASVGEQQRTRELGARFFIPKPFDARAVMSAVEASLTEARA
jgi:signal transduction histidine kinase